MLPRIAKVIISIALSISAIILYLALGGEERKKCMIGMIVCTLGDLFMVNLFGLGEVLAWPR